MRNVQECDLLLILEDQIDSNITDESKLATQTFLAWYLLIEGYDFPSINDKMLTIILTRNVKIIEELFINNSNMNFLLGWMSNISPWIFQERFNGQSLMAKAFKEKKNNIFFKWAVREDLRLLENDVDGLKTQILKNKEKFLIYPGPITDYFVEILSTES